MSSYSYDMELGLVPVTNSEDIASEARNNSAIVIYLVFQLFGGNIRTVIMLWTLIRRLEAAKCKQRRTFDFNYDKR